MIQMRYLSVILLFGIVGLSVQDVSDEIFARNYGNMPQQPQHPQPGNNQQAPIEPWRQYVQNNEQFTCNGRQDGFFPSRWCNVFYRCFGGIKYEFLCAVQTNGDRLWWVQHSTNNAITEQAAAQCAFPCVLNRPCTSPGGVLREQGAVSDSTADASRIFNSCPSQVSSNNMNNNNMNYGVHPGNNFQTQPPNFQTHPANNFQTQPANFQTHPANNIQTQAPNFQTQPANVFQTHPAMYGGNQQFTNPTTTTRQAVHPGNQYVNFNNNNMGGGSGSNTGGPDFSNDLFRIPDATPSCAGVPEGTFLPSRYCNVFHRCAGGRRHDFLCAKASATYELWWNENTLLCDYPCKVACTKPIFGSSTTAGQIQSQDRNVNAALCAPSSNNNNNNNNQHIINNNNNPCANPCSNAIYQVIPCNNPCATNNNSINRPATNYGK